MSFIFEEVSESDSIKYRLSEEVKYWAIDRDREIFIYGGG